MYLADTTFKMGLMLIEKFSSVSPIFINLPHYCNFVEKNFIFL